MRNCCCPVGSPRLTLMLRNMQALYLHALGLSDDRIGFLLFLTLIGDAIISLLVSVFISHASHAHAAARWQRRNSLAANQTVSSDTKSKQQ